MKPVRDLTLADPDVIVWGWKDIAAVLGRSVRTAQERAQRNVDPLPVFVEDDRVGAFAHAILRWRSNQRSSYRIHRELVGLRAKGLASTRPSGPRSSAAEEAINGPASGPAPPEAA